MRRPLIVGNWKMHGTRPQAAQLASALRSELADPGDREVVVAPPFTALETVGRILAGSPIALAAQNVHFAREGAYTGEISPPMLQELGCRYVIIGHSERRQYFGESDELLGRKIAGALDAGLRPILCVGETLAEREQGRTLEVVEGQLAGALLPLDPVAIRAVTVAYEPVWAIGTGKVATPQQAQEVHAAIRTWLRARIGEAADATRILYGGSVKPDNIDELMAQSDLDGALVGGASLQAGSFVRIVRFQ
jgi:triosephosphate isomerase